MSLWLGGEFGGRNTAMDFEVDTANMAYNNFNFTVTEDDKKYYVDWGDGTPIEQLNTTTDQHNYSSDGIYRIRVWSQEPDNKINIRYNRSSSSFNDGSFCLVSFINNGLLNHAYNGGTNNTNVITPHYYSSRNINIPYLNDQIRLHADSSGNMREQCYVAGQSITTYKSDGWYLPTGMERKQFFTIGDGKPTNMQSFLYRSNLGNIDYTKLDLSEVTTMYRAFYQPTYNAPDSYGTTWNNGRDGGVTYTWNADVGNVSTFQELFYGCQGGFNADVSSWNIGATCTNMRSMFVDCREFENGGNTQLGPAWDTSNVTDMHSIFTSCWKFNSDVTHWDTSSLQGGLVEAFSQNYVFNNGRDAGVTYTWNWDTSNVTDMKTCFLNARAFNGDIGGWDVSNVTNFRQMFQRADSFNADLSSWAPLYPITDVYRMFYQAYDFNNGYGPGVANSGFGSTFGNALSEITNFGGMFLQAYDFNSDVSNFAVGLTATDLSSMFQNCSNFDNAGNTQGLATWDTRSVTTFYNMFFACTPFNCDLTGWDTGSATDLRSMFSSCQYFNNGRDEGVSHTMNWDTSSCTTMSTMFNSANRFNGDISGFDTSSSTDCSYMFNAAHDFNQDIGNWDLSSCTTMYRMLRVAYAFNQDLGGWALNTSTAPNMTDLLVNTSMSTENFSRTLIGWANYCYANSGNPGSVTFSGTSLTYDDTTYGTGTYTDAVSAFGYLTETLGWTITGATDVS